MTSSRYKELSVNTILFAISSFGSKLVQFLLLPLYTSVLSTADYGTVDLLTSTVSLLVPVLTLNIQDAVLRFGLGNDAEPDEVLAVGVRTIGGGSLFLLSALLLMTTLDISPVDTYYLAFLFAMFLLGSLNNVLTMHLKALDYVRPLVVSGIGGTLVTCALAIALLVAVPCGVAGYMVALAAGSLFSVCYLIGAGHITPRALKRLRPGLFRAMASYSLPLVANSVAWWVNDVSDRYVVTFFCGAAANGIYSVALKIPSILSALQTIFYNAWSISAIKEFDRDDSDGFLGHMYGIYSCAMFLCCSAIMLLDIPLARLLYANDFFEAWRYVPFLLVGVLLNGLSLFEGCIYAAARRTKDVSTTTIVGAVVSIGSCIILTMAIGVMGAALATFFGYLATWAVRTRIMVKKVAKIEVAWSVEVASLVVLVVQACLATQEGLEAAQVSALLVLLVIHHRRIGQVGRFVGRRISALLRK